MEIARCVQNDWLSDMYGTSRRALCPFALITDPSCLSSFPTGLSSLHSMASTLSQSYPLHLVASSSASSLSSSKADEHSSRMRCHKGNKPSLPQTKYCSLCPAKFTRTTHLNRHLRTRMWLLRNVHTPTLTHISTQTLMRGFIVAMYGRVSLLASITSNVSAITDLPV